ncbi:MAG: winged helix-turn-helix transcriptional regulator [Micropruina sp.]|nr:winged helix-turn-helix transcriptional regulator [Micropruina sp.]
MVNLSGVASQSVDETRSLTPAASLFHSLSDPARLAILQHLSMGEHRVVDLTAHLGLAQSTVSAHLACLRDCGLVTSRPQGRASMFSLAATPELMRLLAAAQQLLTVTGDAVELCPRYGFGRDTSPTAEPAALRAAAATATEGR